MQADFSSSTATVYLFVFFLFSNARYFELLGCRRLCIDEVYLQASFSFQYTVTDNEGGSLNNKCISRIHSAVSIFLIRIFEFCTLCC